MEGLAIGRTVHYVLSSWDKSSEGNLCTEPGAHRPGIIVKTWGPYSSQGYVNLQVFTDSHPTENGGDNLDPVMWKTSVGYDPDQKPGTWHWPEPA